MKERETLKSGKALGQRKLRQAGTWGLSYLFLTKIIFNFYIIIETPVT